MSVDIKIIVSCVQDYHTIEDEYSVPSALDIVSVVQCLSHCSTAKALLWRILLSICWN